MTAQVHITYKDIHMDVTYDYQGEPKYFMDPPFMHEPLREELYIDALTACDNQAINLLLHELLGGDEEFLKAVLIKAQEDCAESQVDAAIAAGGRR